LAANQLTNPVLDPVSKIPEFKVCAVRIERIGPGDGPSTDQREYELGTGAR
jgi:assimilatory nitrate reductase catalytic subunit